MDVLKINDDDDDDDESNKSCWRILAIKVII